MSRYKYGFTCSFDTDKKMDSDKISKFVSAVSDLATGIFYDDVTDCISVVASNTICSCVAHKNKHVGE